MNKISISSLAVLACTLVGCTTLKNSSTGNPSVTAPASATAPASVTGKRIVLTEGGLHSERHIDDETGAWTLWSTAAPQRRVYEFPKADMQPLGTAQYRLYRKAGLNTASIKQNCDENGVTVMLTFDTPTSGKASYVGSDCPEDEVQGKNVPFYIEKIK